MQTQAGKYSNLNKDDANFDDARTKDYFLIKMQQNEIQKKDRDVNFPLSVNRSFVNALF